MAQPRYYLVVLEYFQRTGTNQTNAASQMDNLRHDVAALAGDHEWTVLYPGEGKGTAGSDYHPLLDLVVLEANLRPSSAGTSNHEWGAESAHSSECLFLEHG